MPKRGRPPKDDADIFSESIMFVLLPDQKVAYIDAAKESGLTLSQWIRATLSRAAAPRKD